MFVYEVLMVITFTEPSCRCTCLPGRCWPLYVAALILLFYSYRRSLNGFITFTADQVHLLPGFPVQIISDTYPASLYVARIAIYVNYPPGVILETKTSLKAQILLSVVNTTRGEVEKALNVTVLEIKGYKTEQPIKPSVKKEDDTLTYIIIGASAGGVVLIFLIALIV